MRVATVLRKTCEVTQSKPAVAKASRRSAWVLEGSRQPPKGAGKTGWLPGPLPSRSTRRAFAKHGDAPERQHEGAGSGVGLGGLHDQSLASDSNGGGSHLDCPRLEVYGIPGQAAGLADAQPGSHQKGHQVRQIPGDRPVVVAERGPQLS